MFLRCYPDRITTQQIYAENRLAVLDQLLEEAVSAIRPAATMAS